MTIITNDSNNIPPLHWFNIPISNPFDNEPVPYVGDLMSQTPSNVRVINNFEPVVVPYNGDLRMNRVLNRIDIISNSTFNKRKIFKTYLKDFNCENNKVCNEEILQNLIYYCEKGDLKSVKKWFIKKRNNKIIIKYKTILKKTCLLAAAKNGHISVFKYIKSDFNYSKNLKIGTVTTRELRCMFNAFINKYLNYKNINILKYIHNKKFLYFYNGTWRKILRRATKKEYMNIFKWIEELKGKSFIKKNSSFLHLAFFHNKFEVIKYFKDLFGSDSLRYYGNYYSCETITKYNYSNSHHICVDFGRYYTCIELAALGGHLRILKYYDEHNIKYDGDKLFRIACQFDCLNIVKYLVEHKNKKINVNSYSYFDEYTMMRMRKISERKNKKICMVICWKNCGLKEACRNANYDIIDYLILNCKDLIIEKYINYKDQSINPKVIEYVLNKKKSKSKFVDNKENTCMICLDNNIIAPIPCCNPLISEKKHFMCEKCSQEIKKCPICRSDFIMTKKLPEKRKVKAYVYRSSRVKKYLGYLKYIILQPEYFILPRNYLFFY